MSNIYNDDKEQGERLAELARQFAEATEPHPFTTWLSDSGYVEHKYGLWIKNGVGYLKHELYQIFKQQTGGK